MTTSLPPVPSGWRVTAQQMKTQLSQGGAFAEGYQVFFVTNAGHSGSVFIPNNVYLNTDLTKQTIATAAAQLDITGALSSES